MPTGSRSPTRRWSSATKWASPCGSFHRTWQTLVLRAHGHTATWAARLNYQGLSDDSQDAFRKINLRWHDLRHEYASRLVEQGVPLAQVRDLLGHASITTTERYDNQTLENLQLAVRKLERGHTFAGTKFQDSFKIAGLVSGAEEQSKRRRGRARPSAGRPIRPGKSSIGAPGWRARPPARAANASKKQGFDTARGGNAAAALLKPAEQPRLRPKAERSWLGGRDSNPDKQSQSLLSYR